MMRPIPTVSEVIRAAICDYRDKVARKVDVQEKGSGNEQHALYEDYAKAG